MCGHQLRSVECVKHGDMCPILYMPLVACLSMPNQPPLTYNLLSSDEEADDACSIINIRISSCFWKRGTSDVELDILNMKGGGDGVSASLKVLYWLK